MEDAIHARDQEFQIPQIEIPDCYGSSDCPDPLCSWYDECRPWRWA